LKNVGLDKVFELKNQAKKKEKGGAEGRRENSRMLDSVAGRKRTQEGTAGEARDK